MTVVKRKTYSYNDLFNYNIYIMMLMILKTIRGLFICQDRSDQPIGTLLSMTQCFGFVRFNSISVKHTITVKFT